MVREKDMQIDRDREKERVTRAMFLSSKHDFGVSWHPRSYLPCLGIDKNRLVIGYLANHALRHILKKTLITKLRPNNKQKKNTQHSTNTEHTPNKQNKHQTPK